MQTEMLRVLFLQALKEPLPLNNKLTYHHCVDAIQRLAQKECPAELRDGGRLHPDDQKRLLHVAWDLILERVIVPGHGDPQTFPDGWPHLTLTEHGSQAVNAVGPTPYDPDGYIKGLPLISPSVKTYLAESLSSFRTNNRLAAAVMLGAASERLIIELVDTFKLALADPNELTRFEKDSDQRFIKDTIAALIDWIKRKKDQLPDKWRKSEQIELIDDIAKLIRIRRNEAGHPQENPQIRSHEDLYGLIQLFRNYCAELCELRQWLQANVSKLT